MVEEGGRDVGFVWQRLGPVGARGLGAGVDQSLADSYAMALSLRKRFRSVGVRVLSCWGLSLIKICCGKKRRDEGIKGMQRGGRSS